MRLSLSCMVSLFILFSLPSLSQLTNLAPTTLCYIGLIYPIFIYTLRCRLYSTHRPSCSHTEIPLIVLRKRNKSDYTLHNCVRAIQVQHLQCYHCLNEQSSCVGSEWHPTPDCQKLIEDHPVLSNYLIKVLLALSSLYQRMIEIRNQIPSEERKSHIEILGKIFEETEQGFTLHFIATF